MRILIRGNASYCYFGRGLVLDNPVVCPCSNLLLELCRVPSGAHSFVNYPEQRQTFYNHTQDRNPIVSCRTTS